MAAGISNSCDNNSADATGRGYSHRPGWIRAVILRQVVDDLPQVCDELRVGRHCPHRVRVTGCTRIGRTIWPDDRGLRIFNLPITQNNLQAPGLMPTTLQNVEGHTVGDTAEIRPERRFLRLVAVPDLSEPSQGDNQHIIKIAGSRRWTLAQVDTLRSADSRSERQSGPATIVLKTFLLGVDGATVGTAQSNVTLPAGKSIELSQTISVSKPALWSPYSPNLYRAVTEIVLRGRVLDAVTTPLGIRSIAWLTTKGFQINGKTVKFCGGCVHHDNGILGSAAMDRAESAAWNCSSVLASMRVPRRTIPLARVPRRL